MLMMFDDDMFDRSSIFNGGADDDTYARNFHFLDDRNSSGRRRDFLF